MTKIEDLYTMIEEEGRELADNIILENDNGRDIIIIKDDDAETSDEVFIFEGFGAHEAYEFLKNNGYLK